jgi:hypothetical protein
MTCFSSAAAIWAGGGGAGTGGFYAVAGTEAPEPTRLRRRELEDPIAFFAAASTGWPYRRLT